MNKPVLFKRGTQERYDLLKSNNLISNDTWYYCFDTHSLYIGLVNVNWPGHNSSDGEMLYSDAGVLSWIKAYTKAELDTKFEDIDDEITIINSEIDIIQEEIDYLKLNHQEEYLYFLGDGSMTPIKPVDHTPVELITNGISTVEKIIASFSYTFQANRTILAGQRFFNRTSLTKLNQNRTYAGRIEVKINDDVVINLQRPYFTPVNETYISEFFIESLLTSDLEIVSGDVITWNLYLKTLHASDTEVGFLVEDINNLVSFGINQNLGKIYDSNVYTNTRETEETQKNLNDYLYSNSLLSMHYMGSKDTYSDILSITTKHIGDVYNAEDTGSNYAWNGTEWDDLAGEVDLSAYLTSENASNTYETIANVDLLEGIVSGHTTNISNLQSDKADKATTLGGYGITDAYTKTEIDNKISTVYTYKGTVQTVENLPVEGNVVGDVYDVLSTGVNYAWNGTEWDSLSGSVGYISITSEELYNKKTNNQLIPNSYYRIIDYNCDINSNEYFTAHKNFDIVVYSTTVSSFKDKGFVLPHVGDINFTSNDLSKWEVEVSFENKEINVNFDLPTEATDTPVTIRSYTNIAYNDGVWIAISSATSDTFLRSVDGGATWTEIKVPVAASWYTISFAYGHFIAIAAWKNINVYSDGEGLVWEQGILLADAKNWVDSANFGDFCAVCKNSTYLYYGGPNDGTTVPYSGITGNVQAEAVCSDGNYAYIVDNLGNIFRCGGDLVEAPLYRPTDSLTSALAPTNIVYRNGIFFLMSTTSLSGNILYSYDAQIWKTTITQPNLKIADIVYCAGYYIAFSQSDTKIAYTTNPDNGWTVINNFLENKNWRRAATDGTVINLIGTNANVIEKIDFQEKIKPFVTKLTDEFGNELPYDFKNIKFLNNNFSVSNALINKGWRSTCWDGSKFYIVSREAADSYIGKSTDGITWNQTQNSTGVVSPFCVRSDGNGTVVMVGLNATNYAVCVNDNNFSTHSFGISNFSSKGVVCGLGGWLFYGEGTKAVYTSNFSEYQEVLLGETSQNWYTGSGDDDSINLYAYNYNTCYNLRLLDGVITSTPILVSVPDGANPYFTNSLKVNNITILTAVGKYVYFSKDNTTYGFTQLSGIGGNWTGVSHDGHRFLIYDRSNSRIATSINGILWEVMGLPLSLANGYELASNSDKTILPIYESSTIGLLSTLVYTFNSNLNTDLSLTGNIKNIKAQ